MNLPAVFHLVSFVLLVMGVSMGACGALAHVLGEPAQVFRAFMASSGMTLALGGALWIRTRGRIELSRRDGFGIVVFGWLAAALSGSLPFMLSEAISHPVSALFETMSGFTTTGASVLSDLEALPRSLLFWRALTHFFGGMGVLVLCVAILPFLGTGGMQLYRAEIPGLSKDRLTPRIASTAKLLWGVYVGLCLVLAGLLRIGGMDWIDAFCHAFATMATGGFSTRTASVGAYGSAYFEVVIIIFMFLAGTNFALHYRVLRGKFRAPFRDPEFRFYFGFWLATGLLLTWWIWGPVHGSPLRALRAAFFQGTSILTTTGFVTEDFDQWPQAARALLVMMMFVGGCAGSTGGGMKHLRLMIVLKRAAREVRRFLHPQAVLTLRLGDRSIEPETESNIAAFFAAFVLIFVAGTLMMTFFTPDLETAAGATIATLGNIGPGLAGVGATQNYADIPAAGQALLVLFMLLGRLELYAILMLFAPAFWRK